MPKKYHLNIILVSVPTVIIQQMDGIATPLITLVLRIADPAMALMHQQTTIMDNARNATRSMDGQAVDLITVVKQIAFPVIQMMLHPIISLGNVRIAIILVLVGQMPPLIIQVIPIVFLVMQEIHLPTTTLGSVLPAMTQAGDGIIRILIIMV